MDKWRMVGDHLQVCEAKGKGIDPYKADGNKVVDWIYAWNSGVEVDLDNNYAKWKKDMKNKTQLGVPEGCVGH